VPHQRCRLTGSPAEPNLQPVIRSIAIGGNRELAERELIEASGVRLGGPLPPSADVEAAIVRRYRERGYSEETNAIGALGRLPFSGVLQLTDYLQSVTAETTSGRVSGGDLLRR
jgi:hypothetical protein